MRKGILSLFIICMIIISSVAFADMGAPEINSYKATPKSLEGAPYYRFSYNPETNTSGYEEVGIIPYGEVVNVINETEQSGVRYGYFSWKRDNEYLNYEVKLDDMYVSDLIENAPIHSNTFVKMKILAKEVEIHTGPAYMYDVIGKIPFNTDINAYRVASVDSAGTAYEDTMNPWFYVEYDGLSGWICELNSATGIYVDAPILIKADLSFSGDEIAIPVSTKIDGYYRTDMWSGNAYISYEGNNYLISLYDCAVKVSDWLSEGYKIEYDAAKMYRAASKESEVLVDEIPIGTTLPAKYVEYDLRWIGWIYTEYNGVEGWVIYFEDEEALDSYLEGEYQNLGSEKRTVKLVSSDEKINDTNSIQQQSIEKEQVQNNTTNSNDAVNLPNIILYVGIGAIIGLTACVIILLVNKKKE